MAQQGRTAFENGFNDSGTGLFKDNTAGDIGANDVRTLVENLTDSFLNLTDDVLTAAQTSQGSSTETYVLNRYRSGTYYVRTSISSANILTSNASPVTIVSAPAAGYFILPVMFHVGIDYNSAAYATNTTFRFEINGVAVSATNTSILPATSDRLVTMSPVDIDTTTDITAQPLVFETQTGNPTTGNSIIYIGVVYKIGWRLGVEA